MEITGYEYDANIRFGKIQGDGRKFLDRFNLSGDLFSSFTNLLSHRCLFRQLQVQGGREADRLVDAGTDHSDGVGSGSVEEGAPKGSAGPSAS